MKCIKCNTEMLIYEDGQTTHPNCDTAAIQFADPAGHLTTEAINIKRELTNVILWADSNSERSQQLAIGPSELGDPCDRRLGYRIAGIPSVNEYDPWPAIVGTSIHTWLERAVSQYGIYTKSDRYITELTVQPNDLVIGHSDLYDSQNHMIIDWKTVSSKNLVKFREEGPSESYITQVNLYGLGQQRAGREIKKVCLVALPRAGWLSDMYVWVDEYREEIAQAALTRMFRIGNKLIELDIINNPHRWVEITPEPSRLCGWCPFYRQGADDGQGANEHGCPGW
jgi:hypothetical protein